MPAPPPRHRVRSAAPPGATTAAARVRREPRSLLSGDPLTRYPGLLAGRRDLRVEAELDLLSARRLGPGVAAELEDPELDPGLGPGLAFDAERQLQLDLA